MSIVPGRGNTTQAHSRNESWHINWHIVEYEANYFTALPLVLCMKKLFFHACILFCVHWRSLHFTLHLPAQVRSMLYHIVFPSANTTRKMFIVEKREPPFICLMRLLSVNISCLPICFGISLAVACSHLGVFFTLYLADKDKHWCCLLVSRCQHQWCHWYPLQQTKPRNNKMALTARQSGTAQGWRDAGLFSALV